MIALEHARGGITSSSSSPCGDKRVDALKASVNELQGTINNVVDDCCSFVKVIGHEEGRVKCKAKPHYTSYG